MNLIKDNPWRSQVGVEPPLIHLNHAAVGPWPARTVERVIAFAKENHQQAAMDYPAWLKEVSQLRSNLGRLFNVGANDIALTKNTSDAISMIAAGIDWQPGDNVVVPASEFPSNRYAWESLAARGVEIRQPGSHHQCPSEQSIIDCLDRRSRLLSISAVQYDTGWRYRLDQLGEACRTNDVLLCVDAIQQAGALPLDAQAIGADFLVGGSHKWLMAPEGLGYFWSRPAARERVGLTQYGWCMVDRPFAFETGEAWQPSDGARRFEPGTLNTVGALALNQSLTWLQEEIGMATVAELISQAVDVLSDALVGIRGIELVSSTDAQRRSGIIAFRHQSIDSESLYRRLMKEQVYCAARGGLVRFSPHCYLTEQELLDAVSRLEEVITRA